MGVNLFDSFTEIKKKIKIPIIPCSVHGNNKNTEIGSACYAHSKKDKRIPWIPGIPRIPWIPCIMYLMFSLELFRPKSDRAACCVAKPISAHCSLGFSTMEVGLAACLDMRVESDEKLSEDFFCWDCFIQFNFVKIKLYYKINCFFFVFFLNQCSCLLSFIFKISIIHEFRTILRSSKISGWMKSSTA